MPSRRRAAPGAVLLALAGSLLAGCGQSRSQPQAQDGAAPPSAADAVLDCSASSAALASARDVMDRTVTRGGALAEPRRLAQSAADVQGRAAVARDELVASRLQDAADALHAFLAVAAQPTTPGYEDALADARGQLAAYRSLCPVANPGFEGDLSGWAPGNDRTRLSVGTAAHSGGAGLELRGSGDSPVAVTDAAKAVPVTGSRTSYRVGGWVRSAGAHPGPVTLTVTELRGGDVVQRRATAVPAAADWRFVGVLLRPTSPGRSRLEVTLSSAPLAAGDALDVDDLAVARQ